MKTTTTIEPTSPLEALATEADTLAAPPLGEGVTDADVAERARQEEEVSNAELLANMIRMARDTVIEMADVQSLPHTLPDNSADQLGAMWGRVLDGYGIKLDSYMGKHGPLIMATITTLAIGRKVVQGYQQEKAARAPKPATEAGPLPVVEPA